MENMLKIGSKLAIKLRTSFKIIAYTLLFLGTAMFCHHQTAGFTVNRISSSLILDEDKPEPISFELSQILSQKFRFLGSGGSFYAFVSEDDKYVVKFFKHHHLKWNQPKKERLVRSIKVAYESFRSETGLLFVHLNKAHKFNHSLRIIDKIGIEHQIDLNNTEFLLQRKAELIDSQIKALMIRGDLVGAKQLLGQLVQFFHSMAQRLNEKGYFDHDPNILTNYGVAGDKIIKIDVGPFYSLDNTKANKQRDKLKKRLNCFRDYLDARFPELVPFFMAEIEGPQL
jgi:hypothetical protein